MNKTDAARRGDGRSHGFGIIGAGVIAPTHAEAIAAVRCAHLVAVTDVVPERAKELADRYGCAVETDADALLARDDIDVVSICVPSGLHAELGAQAAAAGKHLVVEKPIDVTLAAADRLIDAARSAGVVMTVISQHRFDPGVVELRRLLDDGALGRLVLGEAHTKWYRSQAYYDSAAWRGTWALDGGSLMNQGIHYVDLLRWSMGPLAEITAVCATQTHQVEAEDVALAVVRFRSGAVGTIVASTAVFPGFAQRLEISGTGGTVVVEDGELIYRALSDEQPAPSDRGSRVAASTGLADAASARLDAASTGVADEASPGTAAGASPAAASPGAAAAASNPAALAASSHAAQVADLLTAIDEGRQPSATAQDGRHALEIVCAVYESARERRTVVLPPGDSEDSGGGAAR